MSLLQSRGRRKDKGSTAMRTHDSKAVCLNAVHPECGRLSMRRQQRLHSGQRERTHKQRRTRCWSGRQTLSLALQRKHQPQTHTRQTNSAHTKHTLSSSSGRSSSAVCACRSRGLSLLGRAKAVAQPIGKTLAARHSLSGCTRSGSRSSSCSSAVRAFCCCGNISRSHSRCRCFG